MTVQTKPFSSHKVEVEKLIDEVVYKLFQKEGESQKWKDYDPREAQKWANECSEEIIKKAQDQIKGFKFNCSVIVFQKGEVGFHMCASCFWDSKEDGNVNKKYDFDTFLCIVSFFGTSRNN